MQGSLEDNFAICLGFFVFYILPGLVVFIWAYQMKPHKSKVKPMTDEQKRVAALIALYLLHKGP
jgi:hypothetical protein